MLWRYHLIRNFPLSYPWYKKIWANIIYFLTGIILHDRQNLLSGHDLRCRLRKGDILLLGDLRQSSAVVIGDPVTHSALYVGGRRCIHAIADGVQYVGLHHLYTSYDTLVVLRPYAGWKIRKVALSFVKQQLGKPYDFAFEADDGAFFCTELINSAYKHAGYRTGVQLFGHFSTTFEKIEKSFSRAAKALHPLGFVRGNFKVVFLSHNLKLQRKKLIFTG